MSDGSSEQLAIRQPFLRGWRLALVALFLTVFLYFASQIFGALLVGLYGMLGHLSFHQVLSWMDSSAYAQFAFTLVVYGFMLCGIWMALRLFRWKWRGIGLRKPEWWHIVLGIVAFVPYFLLLTVTVAIVKHAFFPSLNLNQKQDIGFNGVSGILPLVFTFLSLVVIPPIAEEIVMRGFLYTSLKKWLPAILAAVAVSILFGMAHLPEGGAAGPLWVGAIDTFTLSMVLILLREITGNLWAGISLHALKNFVAFVALFLVVQH